jgi:hypothetical protein
METLFADVTDVHGRTLAHGFKSFEDLDVTRAVIRAFLDFFFHFKYFGFLESESEEVPLGGLEVSPGLFAAQS